MKTLSQLKKDITVGRSIVLEQFQEGKYISDGQFTPVEVVAIPEKLQGVRVVSKVDTTGFYLTQDKTLANKGSFCCWPKASQLKYEDRFFSITETSKEGSVWQVRLYKLI